MKNLAFQRMENNQKIIDAWRDICEKFAVPKSLYKYQLDTMSLLLSGETVFCGVPTGGGKTLAQLAAVLFTPGRYWLHENKFISDLH